MQRKIKTFDQLVTVPGGTIYVKSWTPDSITSVVPILLLHDSLGCVATWRNFPALLSESTGRSVVAYDRLGFGLSSARLELPSIQFVSEESELFLPAILNALRIDRFAIFGHSVGGSMALVAAGRFVSRCEAVITESAQAFVENRTRAEILAAKSGFEAPAVFARLEKYHSEKARWVLDAWTNVWLSPAFANWSLESDLPNVHSPILAIHGDLDEFGSVRFPEMICEMTSGPSRMEIIPGCGHVPHRERPELVLQLVADFLSKRR